jgi:hypothetical protein
VSGRGTATSSVAAIWYEQRFLPTLDALTRLDVERVLVKHGAPGAAERRPRAGGEPGTAAVAQGVAVLIPVDAFANTIV